MENILRLRYTDPSHLSEAQLSLAAHHVIEDQLKLGPDRMADLLRAAKDRLGLDWRTLSAFTGYPMPTLYNLTR